MLLPWPRGPFASAVYTIWILDDIKRSGVPPVSPKTEGMAGGRGGGGGGRVVFKGLNRLSFPSWRSYLLQVTRAVAGWKTAGPRPSAARKWICRVWTLMHGHMQKSARAERGDCELGRVVLLWGRFFCTRGSRLCLSSSSSLSFASRATVLLSDAYRPLFSSPLSLSLSPSLSLSALSSPFSCSSPEKFVFSRDSVPASVASSHRRYVARDFNDSGAKGHCRWCCIHGGSIGNTSASL